MQLRAVQIQEYYPKALKKTIEEHNAALAKINAEEGTILPRRQELARKIADGSITGADAIATRRQIDTDALTFDIDRNALLKQRPAFADAIRSAYAAESARLLALADKRKVEIEKAISSVMNPQQVHAAVLADGQWRQMDSVGRSLQVQANSAACDPTETQWSAEFERRMSAFCG